MELIPPQVLRGTRRAISMELHSGAGQRAIPSAESPLSLFLDAVPYGFSRRKINRAAGHQKRGTQSANSRPPKTLPQRRSGVGTESARREITHHVNHIHAAARMRQKSIDPGLIRNVTGLHSDIQQNYPCNQSGHVPSEKIKYGERKQSHKERDEKIPPRSVTVRHAPDKRCANRARSSDQSEEAGDAAAVVIRRGLQKKYQRRPEGAEGAEENRAQRRRLSQHRLLAHQSKRRPDQLRP